MNDTLFLLSTTYTTNSVGIKIPTNEKHEVFCERKSITRSEFFNAGRNGLNPEFVFKVFKGDYLGERTCEYDGLTYAIYRTFEPDDDYIELYVARKGGTNGEESES